MTSLQTSDPRLPAAPDSAGGLEPMTASHAADYRSRFAIFDRLVRELGFEPGPFAPESPAQAEAALAALDTRFGGLPDEIRAFLSRFAGYYTTHTVVCPVPGPRVPLQRENAMLFRVSRLDGHEIGVSEPRDFNDPPEPLIPFADDPGGNLICVGLSGDERGKVFSFLINYPWEHGDRLLKLADNLTEFVAALKVLPDGN